MSPQQIVPQSTLLPSHALLHYETPGVPPPSARVDPKFKLQPRRPLRLWDLWKYGFLIATKATELTADVVSHHIWGPRRKSWGIEMTILTSLFRGVGSHSALIDIATIRALMGIGGLVPYPSDALVTPVTFRVHRRNLRGILSAYDAAETGTRELSGEWVVGKNTWQRLQTEWKAARGNRPRKKERVILYIHGGAYYLSSAAAQRLISIPLSKYTDSRVFAVDYRLAPETRFPGPLHDVVSGYLRLIDDLHIPPENIIVCGDSAGGGLSLALLMYLRDNKYPLPSGAILLSPWVDLTMSCESWDSNAMFDVVPCPTADSHMNPIGLYLGEHTERYLTHPYVSPLFGDFTGLPPLLIQAGDAEVLRDEITLLAHKATGAGVKVRHELYEDAIHVFQTYPFLEASRRAFISMRAFVRHQLSQSEPHVLAERAEMILGKEMESERAVLVSGDGVELGAAGAGKPARAIPIGLSKSAGGKLADAAVIEDGGVDDIEPEVDTIDLAVGEVGIAVGEVNKVVNCISRAKSQMMAAISGTGVGLSEEGDCDEHQVKDYASNSSLKDLGGYITSDDSDEDRSSWVRSPAWTNRTSSLFTIEVDDTKMNNFEVGYKDPASSPLAFSPAPMKISRSASDYPYLSSFSNSSSNDEDDELSSSARSSPIPTLVRMSSAPSQSNINILPLSMQITSVSPVSRLHQTPAANVLWEPQGQPPEGEDVRKHTAPSVRRRMASASHPDITLLVEHWARAGPANLTHVYKS